MAESPERMRLAARVYTPQERDRARDIFLGFDSDVHIYDGLVTGWGDSAVADQLTAAGFFVNPSSFDKSDSLPVMTHPELTGLIESVSKTIRDLQEKADWARRAAPVTAPMGMLVSVSYTLTNAIKGGVARVLGRPAMNPACVMYEVQLTGPMRPQWGENLKALGVTIASYVPPFRYRLLLTEEQMNRVQSLDFVHSVTRYDLVDTLGFALLKELEQQRLRSKEAGAASLGGAREAGGEASTEQALVDLDLTVHYPSQIAVIRSLLKRHPKIEIIHIAEATIQFRVPIADPFLIALADREEVKTVDIHKPASFLVDIGREQIGIETINAGREKLAPWDGTGERVAVVDSGIDAAHPDLTDVIGNYTQIPGATKTDMLGQVRTWPESLPVPANRRLRSGWESRQAPLWMWWES